jgi:hypothetical protein
MAGLAGWCCCCEPFPLSSSLSGKATLNRCPKFLFPQIKSRLDYCCDEFPSPPGKLVLCLLVKLFFSLEEESTVYLFSRLLFDPMFNINTQNFT